MWRPQGGGPAKKEAARRRLAVDIQGGVKQSGQEPLDIQRILDSRFIVSKD